MQPSIPQLSFADLAAENRRLAGLLVEAGIDPGTGRISEAAYGVPAHRGPIGATTIVGGENDVARLLLDSMSEGLYVVDPQGRTTLCNKAMLAMLGFDDAAQVIGRSVHDLVHHSHPDGSPYPVEDCPIYRAAREGIAMVVDDERFFRRDGTSFPVEYRTQPLLRDGRLDGAICTFVDITHRLQAEHRLRDSQERLALALQAGGIGVWDYEAGTVNTVGDARVRSLFGIAADRPVTVEESLDAVHPGDRAAVDAALARAIDPTGSGDYHLRFRTIGIDDGRERWVEAQGRASFRDGAPARMLGVLRDISGEKEAELHLRIMVNELNHRVKNSLAMVQGVAAQTFRQGGDMETARLAFTARLVALARAHDVLTAARWEGADLGDVVRETVRAHAAPARFTIEGPSLQLSPKAVLAFSGGLHELATNALRYGALSVPEGHVSIDWVLVGDEQSRMLRFRWSEAGGPVVQPPQRRGFGTKLIERGLASELQGEVRIEFPRDGVICTIYSPLPSGVSGSKPE